MLQKLELMFKTNTKEVQISNGKVCLALGENIILYFILKNNFSEVIEYHLTGDLKIET